MTKIKLDPQTTWFISDTHFGHRRIIDLCNRPFADVETMNAEMVRNIVKFVPHDHTLVHCGDVALGPWEEALKPLKAVQSKKILLPGNHDRISSLEKQARRDRFLPDYEEVFDEIWDEQVEVEMGGIDFMVSHYPPAEISDHGSEDRYPHLRPVDDGKHHFIHGHTHQTHPFTGLKSGKIAVHVGVDSQNFKPILGTDIINAIQYLKALK